MSSELERKERNTQTPVLWHDSAKPHMCSSNSYLINFKHSICCTKKNFIQPSKFGKKCLTWAKFLRQSLTGQASSHIQRCKIFVVIDSLIHTYKLWLLISPKSFPCFQPSSPNFERCTSTLEKHILSTHFRFLLFKGSNHWKKVKCLPNWR